MQASLFGDTVPPVSQEDTHHELRPEKKTKRRREIAEEPEHTLFGIAETKAQARRRAREIVQLLGAIEDAPQALECRAGQIETLQYFVDRSKEIALSLNDLDSLGRLIGDTEELLTDGERRAMRRNEKIWRPIPIGWIGARPGEMYPAALHRKEIAYLRQVQRELRQEITEIRDGTEECKAALDALRAVGPLPEDIAQRYALTPDGHHPPSTEKKT
jgi:hypothetical protein